MATHLIDAIDPEVLKGSMCCRLLGSERRKESKDCGLHGCSRLERVKRMENSRAQTKVSQRQYDKQIDGT